MEGDMSPPLCDNGHCAGDGFKSPTRRLLFAFSGLGGTAPEENGARAQTYE